jgi:hypothetical protein
MDINVLIYQLQLLQRHTKEVADLFIEVYRNNKDAEYQKKSKELIGAANIMGGWIEGVTKENGVAS